MVLSRKKKKGKDRKVKKEEKAEFRVAFSKRIWRGWAAGKDDFLDEGIECNHGYDLMVSDYDDTISNFMTDFFNKVWISQTGGMGVLQCLEEMSYSHKEVLSSDSYINMAIDILTRIGTNTLLHRSDAEIDEDDEYPDTYNLAKSILFLEQFVGRDITDIKSITNTRGIQSKLRDLQPRVSSSRRDLLKFFNKRLSCSCLKTKHSGARQTIPKKGLCYYCGKEKERVALPVCSRCKIFHYCSRECQVADWPRHKRDCNDFVCAHKQHMRRLDDEGRVL